MKNREFATPKTVETLNKLSGVSLPVKTSFVLAQNLQALTEPLKVYNKTRDALIDKYALKDSDGRPVRPHKDGVVNEQAITLTDPQTFAIEEQELLDIEVDIKFTKIKVSDLSGASLTPQEALSVMWMIDLE